MRHLLDIKDLSRKEIETILKRAMWYKSLKVYSKTLEGKFVLTAFFEPSTRTKVSFQKAAMNLGARVIDFAPESSSLLKGETDLDTIMTLNMMDFDCLVVRIRRNGAPKEFAKYVDMPVVNAGDGTNEHPTQALLDAMTMLEHFKTLELKVAIVGDIVHSRVARSLTEILNKFGAEVRMVGPKGFVPESFEGVSLITNDLEEAIHDVDVVYALRIQKERLEESYPNVDDFFRTMQINSKTIELAPKHAILMHPGPFNRNVEVSDDVVYSERSRILEQVKNGVFVRMAVLEYAMGVIEVESVRSMETSLVER
ncbi:MAG: Aspartate carbamoyltransferase [Thermotoga sp. 50_1627]|uniref:aspartate carbamoyltransferase catalytic subunit n=1 Tax=Pseudothermotoga sp. TaxID=2033661 RepID=UPI00076C4855|nr:MAG: Aspartate carbamoyltransferase [Thermotoga sp. 50_64]KUK24710.1 MAG: Aspartate carbamoyltransferase [Thermotoga sp. 50_1627]MBC7116721.1 aspartate carbamoyltransferase catalytic subunit [Pseudothermotoga sp.]MDK2923277.1 aspartate carbamoyltransferase catalytic subunit [Pseudothermotoga sp.]HBT39242.1 aspartate carbamoyltransferase [Pseudothermotoga sp.]